MSAPGEVYPRKYKDKYSFEEVACMAITLLTLVRRVEVCLHWNIFAAQNPMRVEMCPNPGQCLGGTLSTMLDTKADLLELKKYIEFMALGVLHHMGGKCRSNVNGSHMRLNDLLHETVGCKDCGKGLDPFIWGKRVTCNGITVYYRLPPGQLASRVCAGHTIATEEFRSRYWPLPVFGNAPREEEGEKEASKDDDLCKRTRQ